jgi:signal peptidase I
VDQKCKCGARVELEDYGVLSLSYRCPNCGRTNRLRAQMHPKPLIAVLLSFVFPGIGHLYAGGTTFAVSTMISTVLLSNALYALMIFWDAAPFNILVPMLVSLFFFVSVLVSAGKKAAEYHTFQKKPKRPTSAWIYVGSAVLFIAIEAIFLPVFGSYHTFTCPTGSMENAIMVGDRFVVDLGAYRQSGPQRGDIVTFLFPGDRSTGYVKRCVAVGGDTVRIVKKHLYVNGIEETLPPTAQHMDPNMDKRRDEFGPYVIPANCFFMLGDNRDDAYDSRFWGPVSRDLLTGKVIRVLFSPSLGRIGQTLK